MLHGLPIWRRSVHAFLNHDELSQIIVVVSPDEVQWFETCDEQGLEAVRAGLRHDQRINVVAGGDSRSASVGCGLRAVDDVEFVAIHDAARPLVTAREVTAVLTAAKRHGAAILATPVTSTVKRTRDSVIEETVDRELLWLAQTPQVARRTWLEEPYRDASAKAWSPSDPTDEAQLLERCSRTVHVVEAAATNFKITTQEDLLLAEALVASRSAAESATGTEEAS